MDNKLMQESESAAEIRRLVEALNGELKVAHKRGLRVDLYIHPDVQIEFGGSTIIDQGYRIVHIKSISKIEYL